jgi:hypothetical protein
MHKLQSDNHAIVINPDKTPAGEHIRRFNAPVDDVARKFPRNNLYGKTTFAGSAS